MPPRPQVVTTNTLLCYSSVRQECTNHVHSCLLTYARVPAGRHARTIKHTLKHEVIPLSIMHTRITSTHTQTHIQVMLRQPCASDPTQISRSQISGPQVPRPSAALDTNKAMPQSHTTTCCGAKFAAGPKQILAKDFSQPLRTLDSVMPQVQSPSLGVAKLVRISRMFA